METNIMRKCFAQINYDNMGEFQLLETRNQIHLVGNINKKVRLAVYMFTKITILPLA